MPLAPLEHQRQASNWDCGPACAAMVLRAAAAAAAVATHARPAAAAAAAAAASPPPTVDALSAPFARDRSVWTVDVAVLLAERGVRGLTFFTALAGVDPRHRELPFYERLERDAERVPRKFARLAELARDAEREAAAAPRAAAGDAGGAASSACAAGGAALSTCADVAAPADGAGSEAARADVNDAALATARGRILLRAGERLPQRRLLRALAARRAVYIALVDANLLRCSRCAAAAAAAPPPLAASPVAAVSYRGHFVVLDAYDAAADEVAFADPNCAEPRCYAPAADLERARSAEGTDDDVLELLVD